MKIFVLAALTMISIISIGKAGDIEFDTSDPFDKSRLPYLSDGDRERIQGIVSDTVAKVHFVLAISVNGRIGASWQEDINTKDRIRRAMQSCEHKSQSSCGLAVVNGHLINFVTLPRQLSYPEKFEADAVPFLLYRELYRLRSNYAGKRRHRALALNWTGAYGYSIEQKTMELARKNALSYCRKHSNGSGKCFLYDVNGTVVFRPITDIFSTQ